MKSRAQIGIPTLTEMLADIGIPILTEILRESESKFPEFEPFFFAHQMFFRRNALSQTRLKVANYKAQSLEFAKTTGPQFQIEASMLQSLLLQIR